MAWDPATYLAFGDERTRPARELLARVPLDAPACVVDLGCGPGNSTALLRARWADADIDGADSSPEMLEKARASGIAARFVEADIATWAPASPCDVIYSNAALHWVADHRALVPRLLGFVKPGGALAFQVPANFDEPCHRLLYELAGPSQYDNVLAPGAYYDLLEPLAARVDVWTTRYVQVLEGDDAVFRWMSGTALRPFIAAGAPFLDEYRARLAAAYPRRPSGVTLYPFQRLFVVALR